MPNFVTDYLKKLSSTVTPPEGRPVTVMDELISRELAHHILDESKDPPPTSRPGLIARLFPNLTFLDQNNLISTLNRNHRKLRTSANATVGVAVDSRNPCTTSAITRNLRPRVQLAKERGEERPTVGKGAARQAKGPRTEKRGKRKGMEKDEDDDHSAKALYNIRKKEWNLEAAGGGTALVNEAFISKVEQAISDHFANPEVPTAINDADPNIAGPLVDGLPPVQDSEKPIAAASQHPVRSSHPPLIHPSVSPELIGTDIEDAEDVALRRGAAYDGDSSRDQDYFQGGKGGERAKIHTEESRRAVFMNALTAVLLLCDPDQSKASCCVRRWWYGMYSTKELGSEDGDSRWSRKPDLLLLEGASGSLGHDYETVTWKHPKAIGEMTLSKFQDNKTLTKSLNTKAYILLSCQPWRRHVLALSFAAAELRIHYFDRSGVQVSAPINWHHRIKETCQILYAFAYGDNRILGFDPTLHLNFYPSVPRPLRPPFIGTVNVDGVEYDIISILWASNGFIGRGTVCFHVRQRGAPTRQQGTMDEYDLVLKDSWVEKSLVDHECSILQQLAGLEGVPSLVKAWTVHTDEQDDDTLRYRPEGWIPPKDFQFVHRVHRRLLMTLVGCPFTTFKSQKELLAGLIQGLEIHERLVVEKGILHRDISPNNMVFKRGIDAIRKVILIDFDYVVRLNQSVQYPHGTGTLPFVSLEILRKVVRGEPHLQHEVVDDLESFFYVFAWICVSFAGPNKPIQTPPKADNGSIFHAWGEAALAPGGLSNMMNAKNTFIHAPHDMIDKQFTPYFKNLKDLAERWKILIRNEDIRRARPSTQHNTQPLTHQTIITLLREYLDALTGVPDLPVSPLLPAADPSATVGLKRPPPSPLSPLQASAKRRRCNSFGSIGTVWLPSRQ